jgi:hypothetical protein
MPATGLEQLRRVSAWRVVLVACLLNFVGSPIDLLIASRVPGMPLWPALASSAVGAILSLTLIARRRRASVLESSITFLVNIAAIVAFLWIADTHYAQAAPAWVPYQTSKLGVLVTALLAPELWVGALSIAAMAGSAIVHNQLLAPDLRARAFGEPWPMVAFGLFALALLAHQSRRRAVEGENIRMLADAAATERFARSAVAIRDLANTPLQTIELSNAVLLLEHPELEPQLERITHALGRMRELNAILREYELHVAGPLVAESFDPLERLRPRSVPDRRA